MKKIIILSCMTFILIPFQNCGKFQSNLGKSNSFTNSSLSNSPTTPPNTNTGGGPTIIPPSNTNLIIKPGKNKAYVDDFDGYAMDQAGNRRMKITINEAAGTITDEIKINGEYSYSVGDGDFNITNLQDYKIPPHLYGREFLVTKRLKGAPTIYYAAFAYIPIKTEINTVYQSDNAKVIRLLPHENSFEPSLSRFLEVDSLPKVTPLKSKTIIYMGGYKKDVSSHKLYDLGAHVLYESRRNKTAPYNIQFPLPPDKAITDVGDSSMNDMAQKNGYANFKTFANHMDPNKASDVMVAHLTHVKNKYIQINGEFWYDKDVLNNNDGAFNSNAQEVVKLFLKKFKVSNPNQKLMWWGAAPYSIFYFEFLNKTKNEMDNIFINGGYGGDPRLHDGRVFEDIGVGQIFSYGTNMANPEMDRYKDLQNAEANREKSELAYFPSYWQYIESVINNSPVSVWDVGTTKRILQRNDEKIVFQDHWDKNSINEMSSKWPSSPLRMWNSAVLSTTIFEGGSFWEAGAEDNILNRTSHNNYVFLALNKTAQQSDIIDGYGRKRWERAEYDAGSGWVKNDELYPFSQFNTKDKNKSIYVRLAKHPSKNHYLLVAQNPSADNENDVQTIKVKVGTKIIDIKIEGRWVSLNRIEF